MASIKTYTLFLRIIKNYSLGFVILQRILFHVGSESINFDTISADSFLIRAISIFITCVEIFNKFFIVNQKLFSGFNVHNLIFVT